jgi:hypothetical protein
MRTISAKDYSSKPRAKEVCVEHAEISSHQVRVFRFVRDAKRWVTSREIVVGARVAPRTAREHAYRLVALGILDQAEVFPGHRYRFSAQADKRNKAYLLRLAEAEAIFNEYELTTDSRA